MLYFPIAGLFFSLSQNLGFLSVSFDSLVSLNTIELVGISFLGGRFRDTFRDETVNFCFKKYLSRAELATPFSARIRLSKKDLVSTNWC